MRGQHHAVEVHAVDAEDLQRPLQVVLEQDVFADRLAGLADQRQRVIDVRIISKLHREERVRELPRLVSDRLDLPERHRVDESLAVTQAHGANGQALHRPGMPGTEHHPVTHRKGVLDDDEQAGDHVLHQLLRTETDGQTDHTGTRQQWCHVDAQVGHGGDRTDHHQNDFHRVTQQRQNGFDPRARLATAAMIDRRFQGFLNGGVEHYPQQPGDDEDQTDAAQRITDHSAQGIALGKLEHREAPDPPQYLDEPDGQRDTQHRVHKAQQTRLVHMPAAAQGLGRFEQVLEHGAEEHRGNQQNGGEQRTPQRLLTVLASANQVDRRDQNHQQDRQVPQFGEYFQRLLQRGPLQTTAQ